MVRGRYVEMTWVCFLDSGFSAGIPTPRSMGLWRDVGEMGMRWREWGVYAGEGEGQPFQISRMISQILGKSI